MAKYTHPGVYIEEVPGVPLSIQSIIMSVPVFIGYTEKCTQTDNGDLLFVPREINSLDDYEIFFGKPKAETESISIEFTGSVAKALVDENLRSKYLMHYSLQLFFANGGGRCFIVSVSNYEAENIIEVNKLLQGLEVAVNADEAGLLLFPDAVNLASETDYYFLFKEAIAQATSLKDRFVLLDVFENKENGNNWRANVQHPDGLSGLRILLNGGSKELKYAAAYLPFLYTNISFQFLESSVTEDEKSFIKIISADAEDLFSLKTLNPTQYNEARRALSELPMLLPSAAAVAGIFMQVENNFGLWKAAANINIKRALYPKYNITDEEQQFLNIDSHSGKSINAIRKFTGRGQAILWGGRTLAGNDTEWKYISVVRYVSMLEKSIIKGVQQFLFEPNEPATWQKIKNTIENYLMQQWQMGALQGAKAKEAFFVNTGLGQTMTAQDVQENIIIIVCGVACVRPAEFLIFRLQFNRLLQE